MTIRLLSLLMVLLIASPRTEAQDGGAATDATASESTESDAATVSEPSEALLQAQRHLGAGTALLEREDFAAAIVEFHRAYELLQDHPQQHYALYNIGQCHERLFRYDEALRFYGLYLQEGGAEDDDADGVRATIRTLEGLLGTITLEVRFEEDGDDPPPAEVAIWVDDHHILDAGPGEHRFRVTGGRHVIEARGAGWETQVAEASVAARGESSLSFTLTPVNTVEAYRGIQPPLFWSSTGLALGSLVAGATVGLIAMSERSRLADQAGDTNDPARFLISASDNERVQRLALTADILLGGAILLGIASTALYFVTDWTGDEAESDDEQARLRWTPMLSVDTVGLHLEGSL